MVVKLELFSRCHIGRCTMGLLPIQLCRGVILTLLLIACSLLPPVFTAAPEEKVHLSLHFPRRGSSACSRRNQGYVTIYRMGVHGHVCTTGWDIRDSHVVCQELGFERALEPDRNLEGCGADVMGPSSIHRFWLSNVQCRGNETHLVNCRHDGWGIHDCLPRHFALVRCARRGEVSQSEASESAAQYSSPEQCNSPHVSAIRLYPHRRLKMERAGFVQIRVCNEWKGVCGDDWLRSRAGEVVCRQLGYPGVQQLFTARPPAADRRRPAWLKRPQCSGLESFLHQCSYEGALATQRCHLRKFAGVICRASTATEQSSDAGFEVQAAARSPRFGDVRLRGGAFPSEGRVEVFFNHTWGVVCEHGWTLREANVVCRQLGFGSAFEAPNAASRIFGRGYSLTHLDQVRCVGVEGSLGQCRHNGWGRADCDRERIASVRCHAPGMTNQREEIRLEDIPDGTFTPRARRRGLVQVKENGNWGPVCADDNWNLEAGAVACRQMGYGYVYRVFTTSQGCSSDSDGTEKADPVKPDDFTVMEGVEDLAEAGGFTLLDLPGGEPQSASNINSSSKAEPTGHATVTGLQCTGTEYSLRQCKHTGYQDRKFPCSNCKFAAVECAYALPDLVPDIHALEHSLYDIEYRSLASLHCAFEEGCLSSSAEGLMATPSGRLTRRALLRFTVTILNFGTADFRPVRQQESWVWHECHQHFHSFDNFATYDILNFNGSRVAEGHKASFCLEDTHCYGGEEPHFSCIHHRQGISLRCSDIYGRSLDCQWIDITDVPDGTYILRISANPNRLAAELDYTNNVAECRMTLTSGSYDTHYTAGTVTNVVCTASHFQD